MTKRNYAFTLADVLITLGIIGVISAMTLPALIQNYRNYVVETRLKRFYTSINQSIAMSEIKYGDRKDWYYDVTAKIEYDEDGNPIESSSQIDAWFQYYLSDLMVIKKQIKTSGVVRYYLNDGSSFQFGDDSFENSVAHLRAITYFIGNPDKCPADGYGSCKFYFHYMPTCQNSNCGEAYYNKGVESVVYFIGNDEKKLYLACSMKGYTQEGVLGVKYCTALIQMNGWHIPKNYPVKIHY